MYDVRIPASARLERQWLLTIFSILSSYISPFSFNNIQNNDHSSRPLSQVTKTTFYSISLDTEAPRTPLSHTRSPNSKISRSERVWQHWALQISSRFTAAPLTNLDALSIMWHLSIRNLRQYLDRKLDKQRRFNELQDSQWDNLKQGAQRIVRWVRDFAAGQREINIEHAHDIRELRKRCAHLGHCIDTGVEDREALEERIEALENLLGIENDEQESLSSTRDSASEQRLDRFTLLEEEHNRMKRQLEVQAHELEALKARVNTQRSGQSAQSYEVDEEFGRAESSKKKV